MLNHLENAVGMSIAERKEIRGRRPGTSDSKGALLTLSAFKSFRSIQPRPWSTR